MGKCLKNLSDGGRRWRTEFLKADLQKIRRKTGMFRSLKIKWREKLAPPNYLVAFLLWSVILNIAGKILATDEKFLYLKVNFSEYFGILTFSIIALQHFTCPLNQPWLCLISDWAPLCFRKQSFKENLEHITHLTCSLNGCFRFLVGFEIWI